MPSLVLRISDALAADLEAEARRTKTTKSAVARRRLLAVERDETPAPAGGGFALIADLIGTDTGGPPDLSARKKHYLKEWGFGRDKPRR